MTDDSKQVFGKYGGEDDKIQAGKPCENCNCGLKEYDNWKVNQ
jgi:hypothetical protein